jgi:hypothetical protein
MPTFSRTIAIVAALAWACSAVPASARVASAAIGVSATVVDSCSVDVHGAAAGGSLSLTCQRGTAAAVGLAHDDRAAGASMGYSLAGNTGHGAQTVRIPGGQGLLLTVTY